MEDKMGMQKEELPASASDMLQKVHELRKMLLEKKQVSIFSSYGAEEYHQVSEIEERREESNLASGEKRH